MRSLGPRPQAFRLIQALRRTNYRTAQIEARRGIQTVDVPAIRGSEDPTSADSKTPSGGNNISLKVDEAVHVVDGDYVRDIGKFFPRQQYLLLRRGIFSLKPNLLTLRRGMLIPHLSFDNGFESD